MGKEAERPLTPRLLATLDDLKREKDWSAPLNHLVFATVFVAAAVCACQAQDVTSTAQEEGLLDQYQEIRETYRRALAEIAPYATSRWLYFLPSQDFESDQSKTDVANAYADRLTQLARTAARRDPAFAYQLLHEAAYYGHEHLADNIVRGKTSVIKSKRATNNHPRLGWKRRQYFRVTSAHYQVVSRDPQAGERIAARLERLYSVWRQIFFLYWCDGDRLESALAQQRTLLPPSRRLLRVVLFDSREQYARYLQRSQPRIGITKGFYDIAGRTCYFFDQEGDAENASTQIHEATHQLFQEVQRSTERVGIHHNFWAVEGVAMYMESLFREPLHPVVRVGGAGARRLQYARYRRLHEDFYVDLQELASLGRTDLQRDPRIRRLYSQSAGLVHFFMDSRDESYRQPFIDYLSEIYKGRDREDSLPRLLGTSWSQLDHQYDNYLRLSDQDFVAMAAARDQLTALCLGHTRVTLAGLQQLPRQNRLEWLDLAALPIEAAGLGFLQDTTTLRQVSFDRCSRLGDEALPMIAQNRHLEELDLTGTAVSDVGLEHLRGHPTLQVLWIAGTSITDKSVAIFASMPSLTTLGCQGTEISATARQALERQRPDLKVE